MKSRKGIITIVLFTLMTGTLFFHACKDSNPVSGGEHRLFRPVLNEQLTSEENTIIVDMGNLKNAISYTLEISRDTFKTVEKTIETDTSYVVVDSLLWDTIYQVHATAYSKDPEYDSKVSDLGAVKTQRFPTIMKVPGRYDVTDVAARVFWETGGAPVTDIKVFAGEDERLQDPITDIQGANPQDGTIEVTPEEQAANEKFVYDLDPDTEYQLAIYSNGKLRGWSQYTTKEALPMGNNVVDLRGHYTESVLADTLQFVPGGSIILLESGKQYYADGYEFNKAVTIRSAYGFKPGGAKIDCSSNFNIEEGASVDSVVFQGVTLSGNIDSKYVFNINNNVPEVGEIKFISSNIHSLRGIIRMKGGTNGKLKKYTIYDTVVDSIDGYGLLTVDTEGWSVDDITLKNSTFSHIESFLVSKSNANSINIASCTISQAPGSHSRMFRWRGDDGSNDVINGIHIHNTIWGHGWNADGGDDVSVKGYEGLPNTNFDIVNTYATNQFAWAGSEISGFPNFVYNGSDTDLWVNPSAGDFNISDSQFSGKSNTGDPRWRLRF